MRTIRTIAAAAEPVLRRMVAEARGGARLLARRRPRPGPVASPASENPSFVMAATLALAIAAIAFLDPALRGFSGGASGAWRGFLKTLTSYGEGVEILVGSAAILAICLAVPLHGLGRRARAGLFEVATAAAFAFVAVAGSGLAASAIKNVLGRARPEHLAGSNVFELHPFAFAARFASFPSGHSTTAGASAMVLALLFPKLRWPILGLGGAVAVSRILLDAHFPSDVIAGFGFGAASATALAQALARRRVVFGRTADGRLAPKRGEGPGRWPDVLAALIARARRPTPSA